MTHSSRILLLLHRQCIDSQLSDSICFFANRFFVILEFLGNLLRDFLGRVCFSFPFLRINQSFLFEPEQPTDPLGTIPSRFEFSNGFIKGHIRIFFVPNFLCPCLQQPQIIVSELHILLNQPGQLSARGRHVNFAFQTEFAFDVLPRTSCPVLDHMSFAGTGCRSKFSEAATVCEGHSQC